MEGHLDYPRASVLHKRYMLERVVKPINKRRDTACARNKYTTFLQHNVMTIFVILKSGTKYTRAFLPSYQVFFFFFFFVVFVYFWFEVG